MQEQQPLRHEKPNAKIKHKSIKNSQFLKTRTTKIKFLKQ